MTQLTESPEMLRDIKKAISMIRGVVSVKYEKRTPNTSTISAIKEIQSGNGIYCGSFDNYKKIVANLDDV